MQQQHQQQQKQQHYQMQQRYYQSQQQPQHYHQQYQSQNAAFPSHHWNQGPSSGSHQHAALPASHQSLENYPRAASSAQSLEAQSKRSEERRVGKESRTRGS